MTEKRFIIIGDSNIEFLMQTKLLLPIYDNGKRLSLKSCCDLLNEQHEEITRLKMEFDSCSHNWRIMYDEAKEKVEEQHKQIQELQRELDKTIEMLNKEINSSEKAFDGLLKENQRLIKMLDNVANYMQKQHKDMPIDDFVEWWNNIATKGLDGDV